jgi:hypothetical protein
MRKFLAVLALAGALGCTPPPMPQAPAPVALPTSLTPAQAVQRSAAVLTASGFSIATSDATAGVLTAVHDRDAEKMAPEITCYYPANSVGARGTRLHMTVSVAALPAAAGSTVNISARVQQTEGPDPASITRTIGASSHTDDACASTGEIEKRLAAALTTP